MTAAMIPVPVPLTNPKHILQIQVEVFHAVATTAENGEDCPYYLAVLIANKLTAKSQVGVDYRGQNRVEFVQNEKYSTKSGDFLRFLLYLCHGKILSRSTLPLRASKNFLLLRYL